MGSNVTKEYIPQLDGIRGLAIILVLAFHYFGEFTVFSFGWCGVDLFFVLSGYLITSRLIALQQQKNALKKFYINRALRILPVYYLALVASYLAFNFLVKNENLYLFTFYNHNWLSFVLFFQNWSLIFFNGVKENYLDHFWSLAVEEQFYLLWPFLLYRLGQKKFFPQLLFVIFVAIIATRCLLFIRYHDLLNYKYYFYNTFCRMDGFLAGCILFLYQNKLCAKNYRWYYLASFTAIIVVIIITGDAKANNPFFATIGLTLIAITFAGMIDTSVKNPKSILSAIFNFKWLKFTGKISYGLYIFHWLVLKACYERAANWFTQKAGLPDTLSNIISACSCIIVSYIISFLSYKYFELFFLKRKLR